MTDPRIAEPEVDGERVALLFARAPVALATVVLNCALLSWLLWGRSSPVFITGWIVVLWSVTAVRAWSLLRYRRRPDRLPPRVWEGVFALGAGANGLAWGVGGASFVGHDPIATIAVVFVVGGMVAGASASTSVSMRSFGLFAGPALLPVVVALALRDDTLSLALAAMLALFGVAMGMLARQGGATIIDSLRLKRRNSDLAEEVRRRSQERFRRIRALLMQAGVAALVADPETLEVLEASDNAASLLGMIEARLIGAPLSGLGPLASEYGHAEWLRLAAKARRTEQVIRGIRPLHAPKGTSIELELSLIVRNLDGRDHLLVVFKDVAERRRLEEALLQSSLLASLGTLAAGVAHEVNNPLGYILGNLRSVRERLGEGETLGSEVIGCVDECIEGAERIRRIVQDLTSTARSATGGGEQARADVETILDSCLKVIETDVRCRATIVRTRNELPRAAIEPIRLNQVLLNLLLNAAQAIPEGDADEQRITVSTQYQRKRVCITITDSGSGIEASVLPRIFDPFFTTKEPREGTGLGLSICKAIINGSGGTLTATSEVGVGTTMRIELPADPGVTSRASSKPVTAGAPRPDVDESYRVLVVDDEPLVGRAIKRVLAQHHVVSVGGGAEALEALDDHGDFDLILCDLMMAGMTGMEVHQRIMERSPRLGERMVFMTGGAFTEQSRKFLEDVPNRWIGKPFDIDTIRDLPAQMVLARNAGARADRGVADRSRAKSTASSG